jgi:hypothetical protein
MVTLITFTRGIDTFSFVPRLPGWFFQRLICGGVLLPPTFSTFGGAAVSPTDKPGKDGALPPVTPEKASIPVFDQIAPV